MGVQGDLAARTDQELGAGRREVAGGVDGLDAVAVAAARHQARVDVVEQVALHGTHQGTVAVDLIAGDPLVIDGSTPAERDAGGGLAFGADTGRGTRYAHVHNTGSRGAATHSATSAFSPSAPATTGEQDRGEQRQQEAGKEAGRHGETPIRPAQRAQSFSQPPQGRLGALYWVKARRLRRRATLRRPARWTHCRRPAGCL